MDGTATISGRWATWLFPALAALLFVLEMARTPSVHQDFAPLYAASVLASRGQLSEAYVTDPVKLKRAGPGLTEAAHERGYPIRHLSRYLHPPAMAGLFLPLTVLNFPAAAYLFRTLSLLALVAAAFLLARMAGRQLSMGAPVLLGLLFFDPVRMTLDLGQTNLFVLALVLYALQSRNAVRSGVALGLAALFKTFVLAIPCLWLVAGGNDKARKSGLTGLSVLAGLHATAYLFFPEGTFAWADMLSHLSGWQFLWPEQQSVASQVARVLNDFSADDVIQWTHRTLPLGEAGFFPVAWGLIIGGAAVALAYWKRPDRVASGVLALCAGLLASPVLHSHYGIMLLVAAAWVVQRGRWDLAAGLCLAGIGLQAVPLHSDEGAFWVPLTTGLGTHWVFVTYRLAGIVAGLAGVVLAATQGQEAGKPDTNGRA